MQMRFGYRAVERLQAKLQAESDEVTIERQDLTDDPKAFLARVRAQMRQVVQALSRRDYPEVLQHLRFPDEYDPEEVGERPSDEELDALPRGAWTAEMVAEAIRPFYGEYETLLFNGEARANHNTVVTLEEPRRWSVRQVLLDDQGDRLWYLQGEIDLVDQDTPEGALVTLLAIRAHSA